MKKILVTLIILMIGNSTVRAAFTTVSGAGEVRINQLLDGIYGETFVPNVGLDGNSSYTSASFTATRVADDSTTSLDMVTSSAGETGDQFWKNGIVNISAKAKFAGYSQSFGYTDAGGYHELFNVGGGSGTNFLGDTAIASDLDLTGTDFTWDRSDVGNGSNPGIRHWSSDASLNSDDADHMITYEITGASLTRKTWLLFWDDQSGNVYTDRDFNDFVVEVSATVAPVVVPAPGALILGSLGISLVGWLRRKNRI